jgi:zinc transporter ZupT
MFPFATIIIQNKFYILSIISGGLLYTALADIFPEFKEKGTTKQKIFYLIFIII